ncbi:MAG: nucleoside permease [Bacteroidales bacterium]|nr:nucleoside permease [Bacteroidales bacterium]
MQNKPLTIRLIVMNFLQYAAWGSWLISLGAYLSGVLGFKPLEVASFYALQGIASLFMPALLGIVADKFLPAQKTLGLSHIICAAFLIAASFQTTYSGIYPLMLGAVCFYMPTISLSNTVAFNALTKAGMDTVKDFPPIRVFGTIGFICAMWIVDLTGFGITNKQLWLSAGISIILGLYSFTLPACPVNKSKGGSLVEKLGLKAFSLFKEKKMAIFFIFSMLLGMALQITNTFADGYIKGFKDVPEYADNFFAQHSTMLISLSQISETLCILLIPFFLKKFGIKKVMLISMFAWVFRFGFLGTGDPGAGVWMFFLSMIVYGVAFDFFNISGALYVQQETDKSISASAQGVFMLMTNGLGAFIGSYLAGMVVQNYGWPDSWFIFAAYALVVGIAFIFLFKDPHKPITEVSH